jgi:hypothetical protein
LNIPNHFALDIHHQPHLLEHQTVEQYLDGYLDIDPDNAEDMLDREEMVATNSVWHVYLWTSTVGHYDVFAATLEKALAHLRAIDDPRLNGGDS